MLIRRETRLFAHEIIQCIKLCHNRTTRAAGESILHIARQGYDIYQEYNERTKTFDNQLMKIHRYKICDKRANDTHTKTKNMREKEAEKREFDYD